MSGTSEYAGLFSRFVAAAIDNAFWVVTIGWLASYIPTETYEDSPGAVGVIFLILFSAWVNYFALCEWRWGQTIGKNAMGIRVTRTGGGGVSFGQASVRNVLRLIDVLVIGWLMIAGTRRHQRLGDKLAGTVVVPRRPRRAEGPLEPASSATAKAAVGPANPEPRPTGGRIGEPPPGVQGSGSPGEPSGGSAAGAPPGVSWGPGATFRGLVGGLLLAALIAPALVLPFDPELDSTGGLLAAQGLLAASLLVVSVGVVSRWRLGVSGEALARLGLRPFRPSALGWMLLTLFVYYAAVALFASLVLEPEQEDIGGELGVGDESVLVAIVAVLLIVGAAAFTEELFFRGFVFGGLRPTLGLWGAALVSALVFGLVHAPTGITTVIPLTALGVALAWLYHHTGSLWPCVIAHALNNGLALAVVA